VDEALGYHVTCARGSITKSCLPSTANERQKCVSYETKNLAIADKNALIPPGGLHSAASQLHAYEINTTDETRNLNTVVLYSVI